MKNYKKIMLVSIALIMLCVMIAVCIAPRPATASEGLKKDIAIGVTIPTMSTPWTMELVRGGNRAVEDYNAAHGANVSIIWFDNNRDALREAANMEDLITQQVDAIIMVANDPMTSTIVLEKAVASGIPTVIVDSPPIGAEMANAVIISDNRELGRLQMEMLARGMGGSGNLIVFSDSTNTNSRARAAGRDEELKNWPNIVVIDSNDAPFGVDAALNTMQNFMQAHQQIDGVWCFSDTVAQGVAAAITGTHFAEVTRVTGLNGSDIAKGLIAEGKMYGTAAQFPVELITRGVLTSIDLVNGISPAEQLMLVDGAWIDATNLHLYPPTTAQN